MSMQSNNYPNATASGSPMNYGGYYPPTSYPVSSAYGSRGGHATTSGQYQSSSFNEATSTTGAGTSGGYGNGHAATSGASYAGYDAALVTAMHNMTFGK